MSERRISSLKACCLPAWAVEAETCFIYMRDEYPAILEILRREVARLETEGIVPPEFVDLRRGQVPISAARKAR